MVDIQNLLALLDGVRQTSGDSWIARCPAHDDSSPSLSIKNGDGGVVLMHCFSGCEVSAIVASIGLEFEDLFPDDDFGGPQNRKRNGQSHIAINALNHDLLVILQAAKEIVAGYRLNNTDLKRVEQAYSTIRAAMHIAK